MKERIYSIPALKRLPAYLKELKRAKAAKETRIASAQLAKRLNIDSITVRKDLEMIGAAGAVEAIFTTLMLEHSFIS